MTGESWHQNDDSAGTGAAVTSSLLSFNEYGIQLFVDEISTLQERGPKFFNFGVIELWATKQPQEALAWAASISWPNMIGVDFLQLFLNAARSNQITSALTRNSKMSGRA
jgi:hypothetical protein